MKDIKGYEGQYAVTSCGKVWSYKTNRFLIPQANERGYLRVTLSKNGKLKHYFVHRLVAEAYIPNPLGLPQVNHKSEEKTENYVNNLEWCDCKYNINYGTGLQKRSKEVFCLETETVYKSVNEAARQLNLDNISISKCCRGIWKQTMNYHFCFVDEEAV